MMIDVIKIFDFNFIIVNSENSNSNSKNSKNLKNSENSQNSVDFKKFEKFITDLFNEFTFMITSISFFSILLIR